MGTSGFYYYTYNGHGDVVQLTDKNGAVTQSYAYDAFGKEIGRSDDEVRKDTNPWRYCGEYYDVETGSIYLRARYYDPRVGRFSQEDPARAGLNWYAYCGGNPVMFVDPSGLFANVAAGAVLGAAMGITAIFKASSQTAPNTSSPVQSSSTTEKSTGNTVIVVGLPGDSGSLFELSAETYAREHPEENVTIIYAKDYENMDELMNAVGNAYGDKGIDSFVYFGHSYGGDENSGKYGGLSVFYGRSSLPNRWIDEDTDWSNIKFNKNATNYLFGCDGGKGGKNSIAQVIASATKTTTYAYTSTSIFTVDPILGQGQRASTADDVYAKLNPRKGDNVWLVPVPGGVFKEFNP